MLSDVEFELMRWDDDGGPPVRGRADADQVAAAPAIYPLLAGHQRSEPWAGQKLIAELQGWAERFNVAFKLNVPEIALCLDRLHVNRYGHFRYGHNGFGLKGEIAVNIRYLFGERASWEVLGTLLHELLHAWQQVHGTPGKGNYHNRQFRTKALGLGLIIDRRGVTDYAADSPFKELLRRYGVALPDYEFAPVTRRQKGESKLKKWSCRCTNIRVAIADFQARCLKCDHVFLAAAAGGGG
jgi:hypothetical protein